MREFHWKPNSGKRGATLIELLIAVGIVAVLSAIVVPQLKIPQTQAKAMKLQADLKLLRDAIGAFQADTGAYPATLDDLTSAAPPAGGLDSDGERVSLESTWKGPYVEGPLPRDPFTYKPFTYNTTTPGRIGHVSSPAAWPYCSW